MERKELSPQYGLQTQKNANAFFERLNVAGTVRETPLFGLVLFLHHSTADHSVSDSYPVTHLGMGDFGNFLRYLISASGFFEMMQK